MRWTYSILSLELSEWTLRTHVTSRRKFSCCVHTTQFIFVPATQLLIFDGTRNYVILPWGRLDFVILNANWQLCNFRLVFLLSTTVNASRSFFFLRRSVYGCFFFLMRLLTLPHNKHREVKSIGTVYFVNRLFSLSSSRCNKNGCGDSVWVCELCEAQNIIISPRSPDR